MIGHPAIYLAQAAASGLGFALSRRSPAHIPIALLLPFGLAADLVLEVCGPSPEGLRFAAALVAGQVYPWAVVGAVTGVLRREGSGRRGKEGGSVGVPEEHAAGVGVKVSGETSTRDTAGMPLQPPSCASGDVPRPTDLLHRILLAFQCRRTTRNRNQRIRCTIDGEHANDDPTMTGPSSCGGPCQSLPRKPPGSADSHGAVAGVPTPQAMAAVSPSAGSSVAQKDEGPEVAPEPLPVAASDSVTAVTISLSGVHLGPAGLRAATRRRYALLAALATLFTLYAAALLSSGLRGPALARVYAGAQAVVAVVLVGVVGRWERKRKAAPAPSPKSAETCTGLMLDAATHRHPTATEICAIICAAAEVAQVPAYLLLPYWTSARAVYATAYVLLCLVQLRALLCRRYSRVT